MKKPETDPNNETLLCERCWTKKTGNQHCVDGENTFCDECRADIQKDTQEFLESRYEYER